MPLCDDTHGLRFMPPGEEGLRRQERRQLHARAIVNWEDASGKLCRVRGLCRNYSDTGAGLVLPEPVPVRALVGIEIPELALKATATVRYCRRGLKGFYVGLAATSGTGWQPSARG